MSESLVRHRAPEAYRVGVDLVAVDDVAASVARFGHRYLARVFTEHELECCRGDDGLAIESLAARFAAKEAALKVLAPTVERPEWRSMEVRRAPHGACSMELSGLAKSLADQAGLGPLAVSLTHEAGLAAAVVMAVGDAGQPNLEAAPPSWAASAPPYSPSGSIETKGEA